MVMRADVLAAAIDPRRAHGDLRRDLLMTPARQAADAGPRARAGRRAGRAVIVCGRFEGVDQRVIEARGLDEVSIGDYMLSGGEPAALVLLDAVVRLLPGVIGKPASARRGELRDGPARTSALHAAAGVRGPPIPDVLLSGNHAASPHGGAPSPSA